MSLSYGLNITKKPAVANHPRPIKRKTIFDDSDPEDGPDSEDNSESIDTIGGLTSSSKPQLSELKNGPSTSKSAKSSKASQASQYGDLSTHHSTSKHTKSAQTLDPSIYDYDAVYDSLHDKNSPVTALADEGKRPKYMSDLFAAAETRKRDQLRAKEKMLAKEREAEGDEFADKEKFVTAAYKRQQEEMRRLEEEEAIREKEAEERKRREGGGLKGLYKNMLERGEQKHAAVVKAVEEAKKKGPEVHDGKKSEKPEKSEVDIAIEKGAIINEDGQIVDKRQLLSAGLNAASTPPPNLPNNKKAATDDLRKRSKVSVPGKNSGYKESARERETRLFEEQVLGKRGSPIDDDEDTDRAAKSRKLEDEILGLGR